MISVDKIGFLYLQIEGGGKILAFFILALKLLFTKIYFKCYRIYTACVIGYILH